MARLIAALWIALAAALGAGAAAGEVRLGLDEARALAARALAAGDPTAALHLAEGVLMGAPGDGPALVLKARALRDLGRVDAAQAAARQAWAAADTDRDRFYAALMRAQGQASDGRPLLAQLWLRRAAQLAPDAETRAIAVRDFRHVRRLTPLRVELDAWVRPSDNLNGAPTTNSFTLGGLRFVNPAAVPLSGERYGATLRLRYAVPLAPDRRLQLGMAATRERVRLSAAAREAVPTAEAADFAYDALDLSVHWEARGAQARWLARTGLSLGRDWRGGALFSDVARVELSFGRALAPGVTGQVRAAAERETRHDRPNRSADRRQLGLGLTARTVPGLVLSGELAAVETRSDSAAVASDLERLSLTVASADAVWGLAPRLSLTVERETYDRPLFGPAPRRDLTREIGLSAVIPGWEHYGFAPEIGVSFSNRRSNYTLFESESTDWRLGLRSVF